MNLSIEREGLSIKVEASEDFAQHALNLVANIVVTVVRAIETYNAAQVDNAEDCADDVKERDTMPPPAQAVSPEVPPAITVLQQAAPVPVSVQPPSPNVPPAQAAGFVFPIPR